MSASAAPVSPFRGYRFPPEIISHAVWLYHRFLLSHRDVEELLAERGIQVSYEAIRLWCLKFGPLLADELRRRHPRRGDKWYLDEVALTMNKRRYWLWRAVDQDGTVLDILVQSRRDQHAAESHPPHCVLSSVRLAPKPSAAIVPASGPRLTSCASNPVVHEQPVERTIRCMHQIWISKAGPPEVLQVRESPDPAPGERQVRIRVRAAGINFADLLARVGLYPDAPKPPCVVGYEVSGVIDAIGGSVTDLAPGERVFGLPKFGGYTNTLVVDERQVFKMPSTMTFEEAAALPLVYLTAHHTMLFTGNLRRKSRVLIHSAAGGVGLAAIQLAKTKECEIFGTASKSKHDFLREKGCHHPLDSCGDYVEEIRELTKDRGLDLILDPVGGKSWTDGYALLAPTGRLVAFGLSAAASGKKRNLFHAIAQFARIKKWSPMRLMNDNRTISGCNMGHLFGEVELLSEQFRTLIAMYETGQIKPHVDKTFLFSEAAAAHHYIHDRKAKGKVLLIPDVAR